MERFDENDHIREVDDCVNVTGLYIRHGRFRHASVCHDSLPTRNILGAMRTGKRCQPAAKIAIAVLNQVVRPFAAKWHKESLAGAFNDEIRCREFRDELSQLQQQLREYTKLLADMVNVEDLTEFEKTGN